MVLMNQKEPLTNLFKIYKLSNIYCRVRNDFVKNLNLIEIDENL